jgi:N-acetylmuramoyl-L-alanine amidase
MNISEHLLPINLFSRPGLKRRGTHFLVIHWTAKAKQPAVDVQSYYATLKNIYGSAHYGIDFDGTIYRWIPEDELAYGVGSSQADPASGKIYTDLARSVFGNYASINSSPNWLCINVEWMTLDDNGDFTPEQYRAAVELYADMCRRYQLDPITEIGTHQQIVGWKPCHRWFVDHPDDLDYFKQTVKGAM